MAFVHICADAHSPRGQAGNGVYELTNTVHPGGGDTFVKLCAGNGRIKGKPLKTVNWADITNIHPYVSEIVCARHRALIYVLKKVFHP